MKKIVILDSNGNLAPANADVINRHIRYSTFLSGGNHLVAISATKKTTILLSGNFTHVMVKTRSKLKVRYFLGAARWTYQNKADISLFVCSDPWQGWMFATILMRIFRLKIPIQIQVHGDIADEQWARLSRLNTLKSYAAKYSLTTGTQIRCVSHSQSEKLIRKFGISTGKIFISPVPLNVQSGIEILQKIRPRTIGLVGRIQKERGLDSFTKLITLLNEVDKEFRVIVIGDGPDRPELQESLELILGEGRARFDGILSTLELVNRWDDIGVLVSTAQSESFGRTIREAVVYGVPVWGIPTAGMLELQSKVNSDFVSTLDLNEAPLVLEQQFARLLISKCNEQARIEIVVESENGFRLVAESWNHLVNLQP
jgi:glycosyltransferase involved in cell wall biosynthesis